jgi:hypothetical protein
MAMPWATSRATLIAGRASNGERQQSHQFQRQIESGRVALSTRTERSGAGALQCACGDARLCDRAAIGHGGSLLHFFLADSD